MILEIYFLKFILYSLIAFLFGYFVIYQTITRGNHDNGFDTFYFFNKIKIPNIFEYVWKLVVNFIKFISFNKIILEDFSSKK